MLKRKDTDRILGTMLRSHKGTSDLNFTPGKPLQVESSGELTPVNFSPPIEVLTPFQTEMLALSIVGNNDRANLETLIKTGSVDCAYELVGECRFRVNVFQQRQQYSMVLRKLESKILSLQDLGLPDIFKEMAAEKNGLILVTGATGSGKSTTLAAMLNEMNETRAIHILTIEDPIEYVHPHKKATFNQRELGSDFDTFNSSLRAALRQAPKVILIGETRDRETLDICLAAASTGHLVLSTLHSIDCGQTINRMIGMFDKEEEPQIRARLAECLRFVVNQRLLPKKGGGRAPSQEIMGMNLRVKELLINGESEGKTYYDIIGLGRNRGWKTHDQCIADLYEEDKITEETAQAYASNKSIVMRTLDRLKQERGVPDEDALELSLDTTTIEAKKLITEAWPASGTPFPLNAKFGKEDNVLIVFEPVLELQGKAANLNFPMKVQGKAPEVKGINPKGTIYMTGSVSGSGPMLTLTGWSMTGVDIDGFTISKKAQQELILVAEPKFPPEILIANPRLTEEKKRALTRLAEIGKLPHIQILKGFMDKAQDEAEREAIAQTIKAIEART